ncbi:MAG: carboxypeptidase regulatory-like domain-containing protein [Candidatus Korobacteraceae bacterium]|jgi:hypothetical protein
MFFAILSITGAVLVSGATVGGKIAGKVIDASGSVIPEATVAITNTETGMLQITKTNAVGAYSFPILPVGHYRLKMTATGFRPYLRDNIAMNVDSSLMVDAQLEVGGSRETVTVQESGVEVETSSTEMGEVMTAAIVTSLPLNGRSYTDLLALQPGVLPVATLTAAAVQGLGQTVFSPSGDLNPGMISINGQRESANGYIVNGASAEEKGSMAAAIIPNLDSIVEFRILTSNYDAEYGNYSGGQINVITKSGTQHFHGSAFEFFRNTALDAAPPLSQGRNEFSQNQYGGTLGGPLVKKTFFFVDYQGTKQTDGVPTGLITVPSLANRQGNFSGPGDFGTLTGSVSGFYLASLLSNKLGRNVWAGEPYQQVFPDGIIPQRAWSAPAKYLMQYIPTPNASTTQFSSSAYNQILNDNKGAVRVDASTRWGNVSAYYFTDQYNLDNPYPTAQGGANVPGFNALNMGRSQLLTLGLTKDLHEHWVNDFYVSYTRIVTHLGQPEGGTGVSLATQGFVTGAGSNGIVAGAPQLEGIENVIFNNFTIGATPNTFGQTNNTYELRDSLSTIAGRHMLKFGVDLDYDQVNTYPQAQLNGSFQFYGTETGNDFVDSLLGVASQYNQNALRPFYGRNKYAGLYLQDTWRLRSNLTLNTGIRWDRIEPWYEKYNNLLTIVPGEQSKVFPTAPTGLVFPGDRGIFRTLAPAGNLNFAPRIGIAYAPSADDGTLLAKLIGGAGKSSIRAGYGIYFMNVTEDTLSLISDNAPYGYTYTSPAPPLFASPFVDAATGNLEGQRFPANLAPLNVSSKNPDSKVNWAQFEPLSAIPGYSPSNRTAYAEQYMLSLQRQIGSQSLLGLSYVGSQAHRLIVLESANPGNAALCLSIPGCGPFGESATYVTASGNTIQGTRTALGSAFGSVSYQKGIGNSNYNAFQANYRYTGKRVGLNAAYTYAKSLDQGSNFGEQVNPLNPNLSKELSSFDMRHNFVISYNYELPFDALLRSHSRWVTGWSLSGVTHFSTGLPVTLYNTADTSLLGTMSNGINNLPVDEPNYTPGPLHINHNPGNGQPYFNTSLLTMPSLGEIGTSRRRFFSGPGMENYDMSLQKTVRIAESQSFLLRVEAFNIFNHAQYFGPDTVGGNVNSPTFGQVVKADAPRLVQLAAKFSF